MNTLEPTPPMLGLSGLKLVGPPEHREKSILQHEASPKNFSVPCELRVPGAAGT